MSLTPGRWLGLRRTSTASDVFTILAFDQRGTFRKMMPAGTSFEQAADIKREIVVALSDHASAVLLDNEYGLPASLYMSGRSGLLMALEKSGYSGDSTYRRIDFDPDWTVAKIKRFGATAVKMLVYYHPDTGPLAEEIEAVIRQVAEQSHAHDLPFFLEPLSYSLTAGVAKESAEFAATRAAVVKETARRLSRCGADVLKLEFPVDAAYNANRDEWRAACEAVSAVSAVPWVLLSAGVDFDTFVDQTRVACQAGASGFLAGRAIWKEAVLMTSDDRRRFLANTAVPRLRELTEVARLYARPWTKFHAPPVEDKDWHRAYAG